MSINLNAGKVEHIVQQNRYHIFVRTTIASLLCLINYTVTYEVDEITEAFSLLIFIITQANWYTLQQVTQVQFTSTDLTQFELRILWNYKGRSCLTALLLKGTLFIPLSILEQQPNFTTFCQFQVYTPWGKHYLILAKYDVHKSNSNLHYHHWKASW